jgi:hypothetical protein
MQLGHGRRKSNPSLPPGMVARNLKKGGITTPRWSWTRGRKQLPQGKEVSFQSCGWAKPRAQEQKDEIAPATQGKKRGGKEDATPEVETPPTDAESPLPRTSLKSKFDKLVLDGVRIAITGSFTQPDDNKFSELGRHMTSTPGKFISGDS